MMLRFHGCLAVEGGNMGSFRLPNLSGILFTILTNRYAVVWTLGAPALTITTTAHTNMSTSQSITITSTNTTMSMQTRGSREGRPRVTRWSAAILTTGTPMQAEVTATAATAATAAVATVTPGAASASAAAETTTITWPCWLPSLSASSPSTANCRIS